MSGVTFPGIKKYETFVFRLNIVFKVILRDTDFPIFGNQNQKKCSNTGN